MGEEEEEEKNSLPLQQVPLHYTLNTADAHEEGG